MESRMSLAFDESNVNAAVRVVMKSAAELGQTDMPFGEIDVRHYDLTDETDVKAYMRAKVMAAYDKALASADGVPVGRIMGLIYDPVGFVFEECGAESDRQAIGFGDNREFTHEAYFWANL